MGIGKSMFALAALHNALSARWTSTKHRSNATNAVLVIIFSIRVA